LILLLDDDDAPTKITTVGNDAVAAATTTTTTTVHNASNELPLGRLMFLSRGILLPSHPHLWRKTRTNRDFWPFIMKRYSLVLTWTSLVARADADPAQVQVGSLNKRVLTYDNSIVGV